VRTFACSPRFSRDEATFSHHGDLQAPDKYGQLSANAFTWHLPLGRSTDNDLLILAQLE
jgi:hypothetical protein